MINFLARPSKPIIKNATYFLEKKLCYLEWKLDYDGGSAITRLNVAFEAPKNKTEPYYKELLFDNKENNANSTIQNCNITNIIVKMQLGNVYDYGEFSDEFEFDIIKPLPNIPGGIIATFAICLILVTILVVVLLRRYEIIEQKKENKRYENLEMGSVEQNKSYSPKNNFFNIKRDSSTISIIKNDDDRSFNNENNENNSDTVHYKHEEIIGRSHSLKELNDNWIDGVKNRDLDENLKQEFAVSN